MEYRSLCENCCYAPSCSRCQNQSLPVLYCDEYSPFPDDTSNRSAAFGNESNDTKSELKGLCSICQNRKHCHIKIPEGGIWHCDNFY